MDGYELPANPDHWDDGDKLTHTARLLQQAERERDEAKAQRDALAKAGDELLWLHRLKRKIDAGTATGEDAETYRTRKAFAWVALEKALAAPREGSRT